MFLKRNYPQSHNSKQFLRLTSRTTFVTRGTRSSASLSFPSSSATTTSRLVQVNTALKQDNWLSYPPCLCLTILQSSCEPGARCSRCLLGDISCPGVSESHPGPQPQTRRHDILKTVIVTQFPLHRTDLHHTQWPLSSAGSRGNPSSRKSD